jgi:glycosyltransferase involved in cell wall biosynthesis
MPVYNAGKYLRPALLSIINQTYTNWELIIADDGSTDGCLDNLPELNDSRIRVLRDNTNIGIAARLNQMIDLANGDYIARMDSDDISYPKRFEKQLETLNNDECLDLVSVKAISIDEEDKQISDLPFASTHNEICSRPWLGLYMPHPTWMGRANWFKKNKYKLPQSYYSEDCELLLRTYEKSKFACVPEILFEYRVKSMINWKSQFKARSAVLMLQANQFYKDRNYIYITLSAIVFVLRVMSDSFKLLKQAFFKA